MKNSIDAKRNRYFLVVWLVASVITRAVWAESNVEKLSGDLSLDVAIMEGIKRSPTVQSAQAAVEEKRWKKVQTIGAGFLPKVSINGIHYLAKQYSITGIVFGGMGSFSFPGFYPTTQLSLDATVPVFDGFANVRQLQAASLTCSAVEQDLAQAEFQLSQEVRLAFFKALAAVELVKVADLNVKTLEDHLAQIRIQKRGGVATKYDTLRVEVQLSEAKSELVDSSDNEIMTRRKLTELIGLERDERPLRGVLPIPDLEKVKQVDLENIPKDRHDIQALTYRAEAANYLDSAQSSWLWPVVTLTGSLMTYNSQLYDNTVIDTGIYRGAYNIGVRLYWNLFDGGVALSNANIAQYQAVQAERSSQAAKLQVPYDLHFWKHRYVSQAHHYQSKKYDIERSEESVRLAKEEERAGTRTTSETLDALLDLFRARAGVVNAQVNAAEAQIRLELALGRTSL